MSSAIGGTRTATPEVSWGARRNWLRRTLAGFGITEIGYAGTGLKAVIREARAGRTVLWRADIDALPIIEEVVAPYTSERRGVMHACGDSHIAVALGLARLLAAERETLAGNVALVFQPAEEVGGGARPMIAAGSAGGPAGRGLRLPRRQLDPVRDRRRLTGALLASPGAFELVIRGRGGHAGLPHRTVDPSLRRLRAHHGPDRDQPQPAAGQGRGAQRRSHCRRNPRQHHPR
ncbi:MAG: M20/M25/M40 family metallo-hydrolase [Dehalococcoidia bacterium]